MTKRKRILIVVALIIVGALLQREFPRAGIVLTIIAMMVYLIAEAKQSIRILKRFRSASPRERLQAAVAVTMLLVLVSAWMSGSVYHFILLVLLGAEYLATPEERAI